MPDTRVVVRNPTGLGSRGAALFARTAGLFDADIEIRNLRGGGAADAKSVASVLALGCRPGDEIEIRSSGRQAREATAELAHVLEEPLTERSTA